MSLIPYHPREGREIVLRHRNAVVVRDQESHRLEIRGSECPTCHQPLGRSSSPERNYDRSYESSHEYVDPDYFRMLRAGNHSFATENGPPSPVRRLVEPALSSRSTTPLDADDDRSETQFVPNGPGVQQADGSRIRREAFSPNYFKTFFIEERVLGKGGKGVVLLVRHEIDGCPLGHFACKRVPVGDDHSWLEKVLIEVELLAKLSHPNLVSYRHVWLEDVRLTRFGPSVACAFILQQYCNGGDLHQYVVGGAPREATKEELKAQMRRRSKGQAEIPQNPLGSKSQLAFEEIYSLFRDITSGVAYLHSANYIHRDLKPSNCLLHREGGKLTCLISDFGEVQHESVVRKSTGSTGTISYCAPEVLKMDATGCYGNFTTKSDIFSLGMILYFMCFGRLPYQGANAIQEELEDIDLLRAEITDWQGFQGERQERPDLPSKLYQLLKRLLALDPTQRPSANEVLLAMRNETNFDNITRGEWVATPANGLRGNRIQNLDSPASPGTPVPGPRKEAPSRRPFIQSPDEDYALSASATDDVPLRSRERAARTGSFATSRGRAFGDHPGEQAEVSAVAVQEGMDVHGHDEQQPSSPRLLMPPPRTRSEEVQFQLVTATRRALAAIGINAGVVQFATHLSIFLFKLVTIAQPCWPFVASLEVAVPLMVLAALEFGWPSLAGSAGIHAAMEQETHAGHVNMVTRVLLFGLHFAVVFLARRWNVLCVGARREHWAEW